MTKHPHEIVQEKPRKKHRLPQMNKSNRLMRRYRNPNRPVADPVVRYDKFGGIIW